MSVTSRRNFLTQSAKLATAALLIGCQSVAHAQQPVGELIPMDGPVDPNEPPIAPALPAPDPSLEAKIGQMIMVGFGGRYPDFNSDIVQDIADGVVGSVVLFGRNVESPEQLQSLTTTLHGVSPQPLLIGIDQEGGWVNRLPRSFGISSNFSAQYLGGQNDLALTANQGESTASELAKLGINLNLAPVVDVNTNPSNPIIGRYERSYSADPAIVAAHARTVSSVRSSTFPATAAPKVIPTMALLMSPIVGVSLNWRPTPI